MKKLVWMVLMIFLIECSRDEFQPSSEDRCRVGRFVYGQANGNDESYNINYVENYFIRVSVASKEILVNGAWTVDNVYKHEYVNDSLYIKEFKTFTEGKTLLTALLSQKIQEVVTTIPENGGTFRFRFDYSTTQQIAVTLERIVGNTAIYDSRAIYYINNTADVERMEIFRNKDIYNGPNDFTYRDKKFTYDNIQNPLKDLVIANFFKAELPDVTYFSFHNRLDETVDGVTKKFNFEYGTDPMPNKVTTPDGVVLKFEYPNCTN